MPNFHRYYVPDAVIFITNVTNKRIPYLESAENIDLLWTVLRKVKEIHPYSLLAYVILPDHFHWLMRVESTGGNFSQVMRSIKANYTLEYKKKYEIEKPFTLWQSRFWDHVIRNERDLEQHFDYIHWNPVKHGYAKDPAEWVHSSYQHWFTRGYYPDEWGRGLEPASISNLNFE
jgi:putative transposase